jgi:UDP-N-acetyl-D-mannosaminuronic acid dehydrogenase
LPSPSNPLRAEFGSVGDICVDLDSPLEHIVSALSVRTGPRTGSGLALVLGGGGELVGVITDADLRRGLGELDPRKIVARDVMNTDFFSVPDGRAVSEALEEFLSDLADHKWATETPAKVLPVLGQNREPVALVEMSGRERETLIRRDVAVVVGQGFVGLTLSAVLAASGVKTIGVEANSEKFRDLQEGRTDVIDSGLQSALREGVSSRKLEFVGSVMDLPSFELGRRRTFVLTVGTPVAAGVPDLGALNEVVESIGVLLRKGDLVALRSTVPVGTTENVAHQLERYSGLRVGVDFHVVSAPERTAEGVAMAELRTLPQVVGGVTPRCTEAGREFFELFARTVLVVPSASFSELVKLASNAYRDYSFAFSNFLAQVSSGLDIDVDELIRVSNLGYERNEIPLPSPGVGGPCLSKDPYMMPAPETLDGPGRIHLVKLARTFNEEFLNFQIERILAEIAGDALPVAALGIAFKGVPETNDLRGSTSVSIVTALKARGHEIHVWDAVATGGLAGFSGLSDDATYRAILLLNNHPANAKMAQKLLRKRNQELPFVFDPWRLLAPGSAGGLHSDSGQKFGLMTLSTMLRAQ